MPKQGDHRVTSHKPQATSHKPQATSHKPQATSHKPQATRIFKSLKPRKVAIKVLGVWAAVTSMFSMVDTAHASLIGYWNFDGSVTATSVQAQVGSIDGMINGGAQLTGTGGVRGGAIDVNAGYVDMGNNFPVSPTFTVSTWVRTIQATGAPVTKHWMGSNNGWFFGLGKVTIDTYPNSTSFFVGGGDSHTAVGVPAINDGQWHHLAGIYDNASTSLYIDGRLAGTGSTSPGVTNTNVHFMIGATTDFDGLTPVKSFYGSLDELSIYNTALNESEVKALYDNTLTTVIDGGAVAPGDVDVIGEITIGGDLTLKNSAKYVVDLDLAGLKSDYLGIGGTLNLGTDSLLDLNFLNDLLLGAGTEFQIVGFGASDGNYFKGFTDGYQFNRGLNRWEIDYRPDGIYLASLGAAVVPEPSSLALMLLAAGLLGARRRSH